MPLSSRRSGARRLRLLLASAVATLAFALTAGSASAAVTLDWTTLNAFQTGCSGSGLNCTWLGHVTNATGPPVAAAARGSATTSGGATITGPTGEPVSVINGSSPRGAGQNYTFAYPATAGEIDLGTKAGEMAFQGAVSFVAPPPPDGHGFTITVDNPRIVLNGDGTGQLYATGLHTPGAAGSPPVAYDQTQPVFNLDLDGAVGPPTYPAAGWRLRADGSQTLSGIVPSIAVTDHTFPAQYTVGTGPNRTPNIFGSFAITVSPNTGPQGPVGPPGLTGAIGPKGETGAKGQRGKRGKRGKQGKRGRAGKVKRIRVAKLTRAPFAQGQTRRVRVTRRGKVVGRGSVTGRTLRVRGSSAALSGSYVLRPQAGASASFGPVTVTVR